MADTPKLEQVQDPTPEQIQAAAPMMNAMITKEIFHRNLPVAVEPGPNGMKHLQFIDPADGSVHIYPLDREAATTIGKALLAPSIEVAGAHQMPPTPPGK